MSTYYFAYGSNMNPARMATRGMGVVSIQPGRLANLRLSFNMRVANAPGNSHANVVYEAGAEVEGVLYRLTDPAEMVKMDPFESAPRSYSRDIFPIETPAGTVPGWVYIGNQAVLEEGLRPPRDYLEHLLAGRDFLSEPYIARLARTACAGEELP
ncbi:gamma-glutamylcyclotransferase [Exilibacterium tricleocarpae]|uniref:Gamma-glutamylcyclotransferase n=1 Tax=Exilibacterium tricleocarpae TaxID=2591008 RepID=A0A545SS35_9GAMM|nr:gamma-glutamylcyclotransferase family protein [Exilibacterium tricleocarpae]TQV67781.1 gamma-glutamylcyclotransferase [Exilibacterium tricleocarpae]